MITFWFAQLVEKKNLPQVSANQQTLNTVLTTIFVIIGAIALLVIVIAGFRLVTSGGNPEKVAEIRKQIMYALVGLIIAALAGTIVNAVLGRT